MKSILVFFSLLLVLGCSKNSSEPAPPAPPPPPTVPPVPLPKAYYVSASGDDSNPGTKEKPFRTIDKVNTINLEPGESILFEGGSTFSGTLILDSSDNGSVSKPVTISSYGNGNATINGATTMAIHIRLEHFKLNNINAIGAGRKTGNTTDGILIDSSRNGIIESVRVEGFQKSGLHVYNSENIIVDKVYAADNGFSGIFASGLYARDGAILLPGERLSKNITIRNCTATNNPGDPTNLTSHSGNGILVLSTDKALIDRCIASHNGKDMPHNLTGPIGIWATASDSVIIQNSISHHNTSKTLDGGGFGLDGGISNSIIQYCLSYENRASGYGLYQFKGASSWYNNILRYCVSINDARATNYGSLAIWNGPAQAKQFINAKVYNNIFYNSTNSTVLFIYPCFNENFTYNNNIFIGTGNLIKGTMNKDKFLGNVYWNTPGATITINGYPGLMEWANATGQEKSEDIIRGMQVDPLMKGPFLTDLTDPQLLQQLSNFTLEANSPLRNKGIDIQAMFGAPAPAFDFYGTRVFRGTAPEPGVHELEE